MDLVFNKGDKLYLKHHSAEIIENLTGTKMPQYQKQILNQHNNNSTSKVYGDDFIIEIIPKNVLGQFVLNIKDYDENQKQESVISIGFSEQELGQFISHLEHYYSCWDD